MSSACARSTCCAHAVHKRPHKSHPVSLGTVPSGSARAPAGLTSCIQRCLLDQHTSPTLGTMFLGSHCHREGNHASWSRPKQHGDTAHFIPERWVSWEAIDQSRKADRSRTANSCTDCEQTQHHTQQRISSSQQTMQNSLHMNTRGRGGGPPVSVLSFLPPAFLLGPRPARPLGGQAGAAGCEVQSVLSEECSGFCVCCSSVVPLILRIVLENLDFSTDL